jgi:hypothetical protein
MTGLVKSKGLSPFEFFILAVISDPRSPQEVKSSDIEDKTSENFRLCCLSQSIPVLSCGSSALPAFLNSSRTRPRVSADTTFSWSRRVLGNSGGMRTPLAAFVDSSAQLSQ